MTGKIVVFGAGATGRGHVGLLSWQAGFDIVYVDKNRELCDALNKNKAYRVRLYGDGCEEIEVTGFRVHHSEDRQEIAQEIVGATLVLTAVFDQNLPDVAKTLAIAVTTCQKMDRKLPLNVIACENMMDSSSTLGKHVKGLLPEDDLAHFDSTFGFPDCMISRVVPKPEPNPLLIITEDYNEWTARAETFKGTKPDELSALELVNNQTARLERKLFIHNGGHAICGYMGFHRHWTYIHEALTDPVVTEHVLRALDELGEVVRYKHNFSQDSIEKYKEDLGRRGSIPEMRDAILRVVRDPMRKLSARERLVAPAMAAEDLGLPHRWISKGIVAVLKYNNPSDDQSVKLSAKLNQLGLRGVLTEVCGIPADSPLCDEIEEEWKAWKY